MVHAGGRVADTVDGSGAREVRLTAIPYLAWANRGTGSGTDHGSDHGADHGVGPMRVWIPTS